MILKVDFISAVSPHLLPWVEPTHLLPFAPQVNPTSSPPLTLEHWSVCTTSGATCSLATSWTRLQLEEPLYLSLVTSLHWAL